MRIHSKFHRQQSQRSIEEIAEALGFNAWKLAKKTVNKLYADGFEYDSKGQLLGVTGEIVAFLLQAADRMAYRLLDEGQRQRFVASMAKRLIESMVENLHDLHGEGEHRRDYITQLNNRLDGYADYPADPDSGRSGYGVLRYFAASVEEVMGTTDNRWIREQIAEVEAPALLDSLYSSMERLLEQGEGTATDDEQQEKG